MTARRPSLDRRLIAEARTARRPLLLSIGLTTLTALVVIAQAALFSRVVDRVFLRGGTLADVASLLVALALIILVRALLSLGSAAASAALAVRVKADLRRRFMWQLVALGPAYTQGERSGELVLTAGEGIEKLDAYFRDYLPGAVGALLVPLLILLVVAPLDLLTFVVLLITAPLIPLFMALIGMAAGALARRQFADMQFLGAHFLDVMQGLTTLKLFNRSQHQTETIARITGQFREATLRVLRVAFLSALSLEMLATLSVAIVAVQIGLRLLHGGIGFEQTLFLLVIAPEFYLPLRALGAKFHAGTEGKAAASRIFEVLDTPLAVPPSTSIESAAVVNAFGKPHASFTHAAEGTPPLSTQWMAKRVSHGDGGEVAPIHFSDVHFAYGDRPALNGLTFALEPGQRLALVGASGSGKSTTANLLLRFITPDAGRILIGETDLQAIAPEAWRASLGWVSQKPYLFNTTIAGNIRLGKPDATEGELIAAAQAASLHDFVMTLPQGYATPCGERGLKLSGGQAQRVAIARAFLRDAPLLILDEATANLDPETEAEIDAALARLMTGRSALIVAHRLNTIESADRIVVLEAGRAVETGTHADLLAADRVYTRLVENYRGDGFVGAFN